MSLFKKNDDLLDEAIAQVAGEPIDPRQVEQAAARVWAAAVQGGAAPLASEPAPAIAAAAAAESTAACTAARISGP